jgi:hypothetical protein
MVRQQAGKNSVGMNETVFALTALLVAGRGLGTLAATIHPYPTQAEVMKKAADAWNRGRLTPRVRRLLAGWLALLPLPGRPRPPSSPVERRGGVRHGEAQHAHA